MREKHPVVAWRHIDTQTVCLPNFSEVNCGSEGADLRYKSRIRVQVKAMKRY